MSLVYYLRTNRSIAVVYITQQCNLCGGGFRVRHQSLHCFEKVTHSHDIVPFSEASVYPLKVSPATVIPSSDIQCQVAFKQLLIPHSVTLAVISVVRVI